MEPTIHKPLTENALEPKQHFHTFNALRFFAFFKVFLSHTPIDQFPVFNFFRVGGVIGVQFFFVLSGFLITYIILSEKERKGKLNLKDFFVRRALRIWPLFYLLLIVVYAAPHLLHGFISFNAGDGYVPNPIVSIFFLENYRMLFLHALPNFLELAVMWSVCVEEHFYISWGILLSFLKKKNLPILIGVCLVIGPLARLIFVWNGFDPTMDIFTNIDLFAFGAIPAYLLTTHREKTFDFLEKIPRQLQRFIAIFILIIILLLAQIKSGHLFIGSASIMGLISAFLILLTLPQNSSVKISDKNIFSKLGVYTYGLYLYHLLVMISLIKIFNNYHISYQTPLNAIGFVILAFLVTFICSYFSYQLFEKHFLKMKRFFR